MPKLCTQPWIKARQVFSAVASGIGRASNHLLVLQVRVRRYRWPLDRGNGPTISAMASLNLAGKTGLVSMGGMIVFLGFAGIAGEAPADVGSYVRLHFWPIVPVCYLSGCLPLSRV